MTTVVDGLTDATTALQAALAQWLDLYDSVSAAQTVTVNQATTIINNFVNRPPVTAIFVDEVAGNDANDGATISTPKKSIDKVIEDMKNNSTSVLALSDLTFKKRGSLYASLTITGIQPAANPQGFIVYQRTVRFLGTAENSPQSSETFPGGLVIYGAVLRTVAIDFALPDVPVGLTYRAHFISLGSNFTINAPTITVSSSGAGALIGVLVARATVYVNPTFGAGAAGHLFDGVAAGVNPNNFWQYSSNLTSA
jgi:hypothetical protein